MITEILSNSYLERMKKISFLSGDEMIILSKLHIRKDYKKNAVIDQQGTVSKSVYYLNSGILSMEYLNESKVFVRDFIFENSPALV